MTNSRHECRSRDEESSQTRTVSRARTAIEAFDADGVPMVQPVSEWLDLPDSGNLPDPLSMTRWLLAVLRASRPDGSAVFDPVGRDSGRLKRLKGWAERLGDPSLLAVLARWRPVGSFPSQPTSLLPLSSDSRPDRSMAILRPDWSPQGDLVAIDHRQPGDRTLIEVASRGRTWLGPTWTSRPSEDKSGPARPTSWTSNPYVDAVEWSYRSGRAKITRAAVLLRGRNLALLGQQVDGGPDRTEMRLALPEGVEVSFIGGSRALLLSTGRGKPTARLIPLGLPAHDRPTDRGSIAIEGREVVIRQVGEGQRRWLPVVICWGKSPTTWRPLTVAYRSKATRPDEAVAARLAWGPSDEGLVVYRSLAEPALRSFLGLQTGARFLVGSFTRSGDVRPILKIDS